MFGNHCRGSNSGNHFYQILGNTVPKLDIMKLQVPVVDREGPDLMRRLDRSFQGQHWGRLITLSIPNHYKEY